MKQTTEELTTDILNLIKNNPAGMSDKQIKQYIQDMIGHHIWEFAKIEKNIRDTSLPGEIYDRMSDLYTRYGIYNTHTVII